MDTSFLCSCHCHMQKLLSPPESLSLSLALSDLLSLDASSPPSCFSFRLLLVSRCKRRKEEKEEEEEESERTSLQGSCHLAAVGMLPCHFFRVGSLSKQSDPRNKARKKTNLAQHTLEFPSLPCCSPSPFDFLPLFRTLMQGLGLPEANTRYLNC